MSAELYKGSPVMVDHTPAGAVTAGDMVLIGGIVHVAHRDIAAGVEDAVAAPGGEAVYKIDLELDADEAFSEGDLVNVDTTTGYAEVAGPSAFGYAVKMDVDENTGSTVVYARHCLITAEGLDARVTALETP